MHYQTAYLHITRSTADTAINATANSISSSHTVTIHSSNRYIRRSALQNNAYYEAPQSGRREHAQPLKSGLFSVLQGPRKFEGGPMPTRDLKILNVLATQPYGAISLQS